ncbi:hypothetical protein [Parafrankia discariae]|uniref:hypothetical protein n=1 Tax=Parafrankia discariae TaxID=365528 RepID=UPI00035C4E5C|nr:hypothetical protein [Parafrankia discariae]
MVASAGQRWAPLVVGSGRWTAASWQSTEQYPAAPTIGTRISSTHQRHTISTGPS